MLFEMFSCQLMYRSEELILARINETPLLFFNLENLGLFKQFARVLLDCVNSTGYKGRSQYVVPTVT